MKKYEVLAVVGEGAYGVVLKCRHKETNEVGFGSAADSTSRRWLTLDSRYKEVQRIRHQRDHKEDQHSRGQDSEHDQPP